MSFVDKVVIVTGASAGIGEAIAVAFSAEGANVVIVGRDETRLEAVGKRCPNSLVIRADVSNDDDVRRIIETTIEKFSKLDILINNAGITREGNLLGGNIVQAFDIISSINLRAVIHLTQLAASHLIKTKGNIINISSTAAQIPSSEPVLMPYGVLKAALNHFTTCAAVELAPHGVRVNTISPGPVKTDILEKAGTKITFDVFKLMTALGRISEPEEIADLALFLGSDKAKAITGSNYVTDNGVLIKRM